MRLVMLDPIHIDRIAIISERIGNSLLNGRKGALRFQSARGIRRHPETEPCLPEKTRPWIARDS